MVFGSPIFLFWFLPVTYIVCRLLPGVRSRNAWLALASLVFYSFGQPVYLPLLLFSVVMNYLFGRLMMSAGRGKRWPAACAVAGNLLLLGTFKYLDFFAGTLNAAFGLSIPLPGLTLPIGISFFTFQGLSYALDVSRDPDSGTKSFGKLVLYISFFPQLIAGPIIKYHDVARQIDSREMTPELTLTGLRRFIAGFAKKLLLANTAGRVADSVFALTAGALDMRLAWLGAVCYTLQIYFDFSGYSDMAIGLAAVFGFTTPENFSYPLAAVSITDFWRRWHISLSLWFRDYLYIPLGGGRCGRRRKALNKAVVFLLCGLWHGAGWTFLLWGAWHAIFSALESLGVIDCGRLGRTRPGRILCRVYTLAAVCLGFVIFRAADMGQALAFFRALFTGFHLTAASSLALARISPAAWCALLAGIVGSTPLGPRLKAWALGLGETPRRWVTACSYAGTAALFALCLMAAAGGSFQPFIYAQF